MASPNPQIRTVGAWAVAVLLLIVPFLVVSAAESGYRWHSPISIQANSDFTIANGVARGKGTPSNPYIIEGLEIDEQQGGIRIRDTDAHLIIRDVFIHRGIVLVGGLLLTIGISIIGVHNATVERTIVSGYHRGIWVLESSNVTIRESRIEANQMGVSVGWSANVTVSNSRIALHRGAGLGLDSSTSNVSVFHNDFVDNGDMDADLQRDRERIVMRFWDDGYPSGGNFWSGYDGVDVCGRPSQLVCPMPDGLGDEPYVLGSSVVDRYPLLAPSTHTPPVPFSVLNPPPVTLGILLTVSVIIGSLLGRRNGRRGSGEGDPTEVSRQSSDVCRSP